MPLSRPPFARIFPSGVPQLIRTPTGLIVRGAPPRPRMPPVWHALRWAVTVAAIVLVMRTSLAPVAKAVLLGAAVVLAGAVQAALDARGLRTVTLDRRAGTLEFEGCVLTLGAVRGAELYADPQGEHVLCLKTDAGTVPLFRGGREALLEVWDHLSAAVRAAAPAGRAARRAFPPLAPPELG